MITVTIYDNNGDEVQVSLPGKMIVCPRCEGKGVHDHPAFSEGIASREFDEDPEFREDYFSGRYDVTCSECHGKNVVEVLHREACVTTVQRVALAAYLSDRRADAEARNVERMERMMGA